MTWSEFVALARQIFEFELLSLGGQPLTLRSVATLFVILIIAAWVSKVLQKVVLRAMRLRRIEDKGTLGTAGRLTHWTIMVVSAGIALETIGFDLTALFTAGALLGVAVAFAMQNILQNFVSGIILLVERSITPNDVLEVDGSIVRVEEMRIRATIVRTLDEEELIIPNSILVQSTVKNFTLRDSFYRLRSQVGVSYGSDVDQVQRVLYQAAISRPERSMSKDPRVQLLDFGDSSVIFDVSIWIDDPWEGRAIRSHLNFAIWHALKEAGITIAFPQLDVHFDRSPEEAAHES